MSPVARLREEPMPEAPLQLDAFLPLRLSSAADAVSGIIARAYQDRFGLSISQWRVICLLADAVESTPALMAGRSGMEPQTVLEAAGGLMQRGLVEPAEAGLRLTPEGERLHAQIAPLALAYEAALIAGLSPGEVATLKRLLGRLQTAARSPAGDPAA